MSRARRLTLRSSRRVPAGRFRPSFHSRPYAPSHHARLNSNVSRHTTRTVTGLIPLDYYSQHHAPTVGADANAIEGEISLADIFLSYASEDREAACLIAQALESQSWTVWWDRKIPAGQAFDEVIEREIGMAKSVVVLWSKNSTKSEWVKNEAAAAVEHDKNGSGPD